MPFTTDDARHEAEAERRASFRREAEDAGRIIISTAAVVKLYGITPQAVHDARKKHNIDPALTLHIGGHPTSFLYLAEVTARWGDLDPAKLAELPTTNLGVDMVAFVVYHDRPLVERR